MSPLVEPRLARACARLVIPTSVREDSLGDLAEGFRRRVARSGGLMARRWYWWQVLRAVPVRLSEGAATVTSAIRGLAAGGWGRDLRTAFRAIRRRPTYAVSVVATVGIGLGAATAIVTVADGVWFRGLSLPDGGRVVRVYELERPAASPDGAPKAGAEPGHPSLISPPLLDDLSHYGWDSFSGFAAFVPESMNRVVGDHVEHLSAQRVSVEAFDVLGIRPALGQPFSDARAREVVLADAFWRRAFGADPGVIGRTLQLDGDPYLVVGVLPAKLPYPRNADVWAPLYFGADQLVEPMRGARYLDVVARVLGDASVDAAAREVDAFVGGLGSNHPMHAGSGAVVVSLRDDLARPYTRALTLLVAAAGAFLLITAANVAGLGAARVAESRRDRAVRLALGASRVRLLRTALVENAVLTAGGAAIAALIAIWVLTPIKRLAPAGVPRLAETQVDGRILLMLLGAAAVVAVATGLASHVLGRLGVPVDIGRDIGAFRERYRGRRVLLVSQIAVATVLLVGGVVVGRYFRTLAATDLGFRPEGLAAAPVALTGERYAEDAARAQFFDQVVGRLRAQGLVAALAVNPPIVGSTMRFGYSAPGEEEQSIAQYHTVTPGYFSLLGIPLVAGRDFDLGDDTVHGPVIIVSELVARRHFPAGDAVGRRISVSGRHGLTERTIVGVVGSTRHFGPDQDPPPELYVPSAQDTWGFGQIVVAGVDGATVPPTALADAIRLADPQIPAAALQPMVGLLTTWFAPLRFQMVILSLLAGVGVLLGGIGLYGFIAYLVSARTREIGIRMALGASRGAVAFATLRQGLILSLLGVTIGGIVAVALQQAFRSLVPGVDPTDPLAYGPVILVVSLVAAVACTLPAHRASTVDPSVALRHD